MFLVLIFSVQFYFLARVFNKNKLKTILTVIGLYFGCMIILGFVLAYLFFSKTIDIGLDFPQNATPESINIYTESLQQYISNSKIPIILNLLTFILIGVVYYSYLKRKWSFEVINNEIVKQKSSVNEEEQIVLQKPKLDAYLHFHTVNEKNIHLIQPLARQVWDETYKDILDKYQVDYMIDMMCNPNKITEDISKGNFWEILKVDNVPSGYLHYYYNKEENMVYLSKIYLNSSNQAKGIGQIMMNRVIAFAKEKQAKFIQLTVNKNNAKAIGFYERNGFKNVESKVFEIGNGYVMDDYIYRKTL